MAGADWRKGTGTYRRSLALPSAHSAALGLAETLQWNGLSLPAPAERMAVIPYAVAFLRRRFCRTQKWPFSERSASQVGGNALRPSSLR